jgi:large subunit ribosomal protein L17
MVTQLIEHERIQTTVAKAKELRRLADKVVTLGKRGNLHARRQAAKIIRTDDALRKLFDVIAPRYALRDGGYTRVLKTGRRLGDAAPTAFIEYVDRVGELRPARPPVQPTTNPFIPEAAKVLLNSNSSSSSSSSSSSNNNNNNNSAKQ